MGKDKDKAKFKVRKPIRNMEGLQEDLSIAVRQERYYRYLTENYTTLRGELVAKRDAAQSELDRLDQQFAAAPQNLKTVQGRATNLRAAIKGIKYGPKLDKVAKLRKDLAAMIEGLKAEHADNPEQLQAIIAEMGLKGLL